MLTFLTVLAFVASCWFSGRTRNSHKPCFGDVRPVELVRASNLSVETSSPSGCNTGQCLFVCVGKDTLKNLMTFQILSIIF